MQSVYVLYEYDRSVNAVKVLQVSVLSGWFEVWVSPRALKRFVAQRSRINAIYAGSSRITP